MYACTGKTLYRVWYYSWNQLAVSYKGDKSNNTYLPIMEFQAG